MYGTDIQFTDALFIVGAAIFTAALSESLSWLLIYRTEDYQTLKRNIEATSKKVDKLKESIVVVSKQKAQEKKKERNEAKLKEWNQQLTLSKFKSTGIVAIFMIAFMSTLSSTYHGVVVAKLPFTPIGLFQGITHRNLPGDDYTDCSMIFLYLLASIVVRSNIQKYFAFAPKSSFSMWEPPKY